MHRSFSCTCTAAESSGFSLLELPVPSVPKAEAAGRAAQSPAPDPPPQFPSSCQFCAPKSTKLKLCASPSWVSLGLLPLGPAGFLSHQPSSIHQPPTIRQNQTLAPSTPSTPSTCPLANFHNLTRRPSRSIHPSHPSIHLATSTPAHPLPHPQFHISPSAASCSWTRRTKTHQETRPSRPREKKPPSNFFTPAPCC